MITYQVETIDDVRAEIEPMLEAHWLEISTDKGLKPLVIDWDGYYHLEDRGWLRILTARDEPVKEFTTDGRAVMNEDGTPCMRRGRLVGYFVSFLMPNLHYQETRIALNDILYIDPAHRRGTTGYRLVKEAAADLKNLGADILTIHMKVSHPFRNLLTRQGFTLTEENWEKVL